MSKKTNWIIAGVAVVVIAAGAYTIFGHQGNKSADKTVTIGVMAGDKNEDEIWKSVIKTAKDKYGITLKTKKFTDYLQPNKALSSGDIDLNAFQNYPFLDNWNSQYKTNIVSIGDTWTTPLRIYSDKYKNVSDIKSGDQITVSNDPTNENRGIHLLAEAGLIKVKDTTKATPKDITSNPKNLKVTPVDASQTASSLKDPTVGASVINTNFAKSAKIDVESAIYVEKLNKDSQQYFNFIAANKKDKDKQVYKDVVKSLQTDKTKSLVKKFYGTAQITVWDYKK
ncbi:MULTISPECIES: MetQ/NlpA family ABC transporter substrate-binding protein [Leuconostoc]|uniref:Lipoprotein n=2 Tax=Leuconostoc kimchii TaxID=136609 RepID=D5T4C2_LEUKI|nr:MULTISPECIES: MetQ/NlpA family ABC transporter substrate-binding protein [Leuconostoc]ADG41060.1 outer membrane lipoprotein precursor [Leuconostoc kimchii IMSNU 11154]AEJ30968.1 outer membrane lipoprotein precursor [Leuconostoc sp. C2]QBR48065.1 MetQ/NlpA family ABC transporter substrate-binding protein [Leuconostoc kimchii]